MRYSYKFKRTCVDSYRKGSWLDLPIILNWDDKTGLQLKIFR